jgi:hypothetical protein
MSAAQGVGFSSPGDRLGLRTLFELVNTGVGSLSLGGEGRLADPQTTSTCCLYSTAYGTVPGTHLHGYLRHAILIMSLFINYLAPMVDVNPGFLQQIHPKFRA